MFDIIEKLQPTYISNPTTGMCKCGHKWSHHYIERANGNCYYFGGIVESRFVCSCKGYKE